MESMKEMFGSNISSTDARHNQDSIKGNGGKAAATNVQVFSVDKVTVEKIVLESSNGLREILLTKNETSQKLSLSSETKLCIVEQTRDKRRKSTSNDNFQISVPEDAFTSGVKGIVLDDQSKLPILRSQRSDGINPSNEKNKIKPIKFIKNPLISSIDSLNLVNIKQSKVPPKVPRKTARKRDSFLTATSVTSTKAESFKYLRLNREEVDKVVAEVKQKQLEQEIPKAKNTEKDKRSDNSISSAGIKKSNKASKAANIDRGKTKEIKKQKEIVEESRGKNARLNKDAQYHLEKSQVTIEALQKNLCTSIHASIAQSYKEKLLSLQTLKPSSITNRGERLSAGFDKDFLKRYNPDKRLKIEEKRLLETDLDYVSDNDKISENENRPSVKFHTERRYSAKVTEVEKRWSGEFLVRHLQRNSSESSKSSYVEEFDSVSSLESIVEDRDTKRLLFDRAACPTKCAERSTSIDECKKQTLDEIFENSIVSTVDSDSCLEDRIKAVDEDIACVTNEIQTEDNDDIDELDRAYDHVKDENRWNRKIDRNTILMTTAIVHNQRDQNLKEKNFNNTIDVDCYNPNSNAVKSDCGKNIGNCVLKIPCIEKNFSTEKRNDTNIGFAIAINSKEPIHSTFVLQDCADHCNISNNKDGYANLVKEMMEAGSSKMKKEEKQKRKLGFRRLLPAIFSPKESRKDYKKKEQKERKRYDERYFARYQQNGNYTRSPDTMNLNEDIKKNVKLDSSLNGSIIDERLDQIKRELFPEQQGPITSTPDHFLQTMDDTRLLREQGKGQRSYTTGLSLSSIALDERWMDRGATHISILPDIRKYEQQQRQEERDSHQRYERHMLERKHSLQEPSHSTRRYFFQRNHAASGRISAPPSERYLMRPRAIHPVDRPLPAIPQSHVELSNYGNYEEDRLCNLSGLNIADNGNYQNQLGFYQNDKNLETSLIHAPQSVPAQVKITRQPIVNQTQRAPLIGRIPKYSSPGSSQKSGDYADSSCTPNSSQKSEFSPSSSKSGEYYLNSPRSSARTSPTERSLFEDTQKGIYENEARSAISQSSSNYAKKHIYDETPSSSCREEHFPSMKTSNHTIKNLLEKKNDLYKQKSNKQLPFKNSFLQSYEHNEAMQTKLKRKIKKLCEDSLRNHENTNLKNNSSALMQNVSSSKHEIIAATSPGSRTRRSQPNDQILIASPKREMMHQSQVSRPSNKAKLCDAESPVPIGNSHNISSIASINVQDQYGDQNPCITARSMESRTASSSGLPRSTSQVSRPEPIYGQCRQRQNSSQSNASDINKDGHENNQSPPRLYNPLESHCDVNEKVDRTQNQSSVPQSLQLHDLEVNQAFNELERRVVRSPIREPLNTTQNICQQHRPDVIAQQQALFATSASLSDVQQPSPTANKNKMHAENISSLQHEPIYERRLPQQYQSQQQHLRQQDQKAVYIQPVAEVTCDSQQNHPVYGLLSSTKGETRQHLEAFYWQQKALEAHWKSAASPLARSGSQQTTPKIDLPEMREAMYWQQLKRLDEEQQRRIYEQNLIMDGVYETYYKMKTGKLVSSDQRILNPNVMIAPSPVVHRNASYWINAQHQQRPKTNSTGKLSLILQTQKGQNQPVLIVRPQQQALRDHQELMSIKPAASLVGSCNTSRSKSASPHFHRDETESYSELTCGKSFMERSRSAASPRKPEVSGAAHEESSTDGDNKQPHPIFKRGSLIGGDLVEYGNAGFKRVSFSNQSNTARPDLAMTGNWPTKHGTAVEPPIRRHRSEDNASDIDSMFLHQDRCDAATSQNIVSYGACNASPAMEYRTNTDNCTKQEYDANRPLPPLPKDSLIILRRRNGAKNYVCNDVRWNDEEQRGSRRKQEEEWNPDGKGRHSNDTGGSVRGEVDLGSNELTPGRRPGVGGSGGGGSGVGVGGGGSVLGVGAGGNSGGGGSGGRSSSGSGRSRDEPRRHTLGGNDHQASLHHQQFNAQQLHPLHPHHLPPSHSQYGNPPTRHTTMDLESPLPRGYPPPSTMLFDDDPGIMSEVETSSTGFRRGGKQRSSLPVVRTPSKTLERPLGLVFLQYRNETKRALLPNEITSIDTVKALFVRSFPKQLTMEYLDSPHVKVYIHDSNKDMFYELEDIRSHLRDIKDRSVLRLFESADGMTGMPGPLGMPGGGGLPPHWEDQSYFSEPEFDSEYQHQHIHKSKTAKNSTSGSGYYVGGSSTLPRGGSLLRAYSPAASSVISGPNATPTQPKTLTTPDRLHGESGYMSSPERGAGVGSGSGRYPGPYSAGSSYEDPYYSQYSGTVTPVIDEEARIRVEHMERQLANLTGLVQKALTHAPHTSSSPREYLQVPPGRDSYGRTAVSQPAVTDDSYLRTDVKPPKLGKDKSVSFEKSVSFSDEPPDMNSPKQHSPQHAADTKPTKPAIKSSTLPRMSSQERDRHKPTPPPKPAALVAGQYVYRDLALTPEMYNQLRGLQKKAKDLRQEVRNLRRMSQAQAHTVRETIKDTFITIRAMLLSGGDTAWTAGDTEKIRLSREEDLYKQEMIRLEKDLTELESTVEELRGNVINRKTRVNMSDVENMALILSKSSKTVADLKVRFPSLQEGMKGLLSSEMEKVVREEKFLKEEPERLESALRRCKKLTGTLVTLKRLASVQEQRLPNAASVDAEDTPPITPTSAQHSKYGWKWSTNFKEAIQTSHD